MEENKKNTKKIGKSKIKLDITDSRKIIYILLAIIVILIVVVICLLLKKSYSTDNSRENTKIENGIEVSDNKKILQERDLDGIKFTNVSLTQENGVGTIYADLVNTTDTKQEEFNLDIKFKDKDGNVILALGDIIPALEPNQTYNFNSTVKFDFVNAYDMEVKKVNNEKKVEAAE